MIYTGSFKDLSPHVCWGFEEIWIIVRSLKNPPKFKNCFHHPELSPQDRLFSDYISWRSQGKWDENMFQHEYVPRFLRDIKKTPEAKQSLNKLWELGKDHDILLICFCPDETLCHRSIIKGLLQGVAIERLGQEAVDMSPDYSRYYSLYKNLM